MKSKLFIGFLCTILLALNGCGISKEEYEEKVASLDAAKQETAKLESQLKEKDAKIAELEKVKKEEAYSVSVPDFYAEYGAQLGFSVNESLLEYLDSRGVSASKLSELIGERDWLSTFLRSQGYGTAQVDKYKSNHARYRGMEPYWFDGYVHAVLGNEGKGIKSE